MSIVTDLRAEVFWERELRRALFCLFRFEGTRQQPVEYVNVPSQARKDKDVDGHVVILRRPHCDRREKKGGSLLLALVGVTHCD